MMKFINNPFDILLQIMNEHFPDSKCDIVFASQETDGKETFGCTIFPKDKNELPVIEINESLGVWDATEILAHELAHLIAGEDAEHDNQWASADCFLHEQFIKETGGCE